MRKNKAVVIELEGDIDLTPQSAYDVAKADGYLGTEEEFAKLLNVRAVTQEEFDAIPGRLTKLTTTTEKSDFHHITDSVAGKVIDFGMEGLTEQPTTSGTNYLNVAELEKGLLYNASGSVGSTDGYDKTYRTFKKNMQAGTYTIFINGTKIGIERIILNGEYKSINTVVSHYNFTVNTDSEVAICFKKENTVEFTDSEEIQINEGSTVKPYEPFTNGPSPNPTHPQDIKLAGVLNEETGRYEHKCCVGNKNLWDKEYASDVNNWHKGDYKYYSLYVGAGNRVSISLPSALNTGLGFYVNIADEDTQKGGAFGYYWLYHSDAPNLCKQSVSFASTEDYIHFNIYGNFEVIKQYVLDSLQVEWSDAPTDYVSRKSTKFTLTSDRPLTMWDYKAKRDGLHGWSINHYKRVFDGTEKWKEFDTDKIVLYDFEVLPIKHEHSEAIGSKSEHFREVNKLANITINTFVTCCSGASTWTVFKVEMSVDDWKAYLAEQYANGTPVYIIYPTAEEQAFIPLPDEEQTLLNNLETYYGVTNVYNEQGCPMWLTYVQDTKIAVDNKFENIRQALVSLGANV